jgi:hypothetical protein
MVVEAAMRATGLPADAAAVNAAMQTLTVDKQGLRGGPIQWTPDNHFRATQYYRVYRWNPDAGAIEVVRDWFSYDVE